MSIINTEMPHATIFWGMAEVKLENWYPVRMLDAEFLLPVRATNSRQENTKSPIISRFFCACRSGVLPFFPFILGFFFQFFCCVQCCWSRWPTAKRRYRHFHKSHFFSKLSHTRWLKKLSFFLMDAVVAVHCVKSDIFQEGLSARIYENASENIMKMMLLESTFLQVYKKR